MNSSIDRIIFMGTPDFAVPSLSALLEDGNNVVAVITQPDRPKGRGRKLTPTPVKQLAMSAGLPVLQPSKIRSAGFRQELADLKPDIIVVTAYGRILPLPILNLPPYGTINVHGSLLPKYRGAAPIQWALINGDQETGVTIMQMDEGMDTGDILLTEKIAINTDDTAGTLAARMAEVGGRALIRALALLRAGRLEAIGQDDTLASLAPPLSKEAGQPDWTQPAATLSCLIRGLDPWPGTYINIDGQRLKICAPQVINSATDEQMYFAAEDAGPPLPGTLCRANAKGLLIATGRDFLLIREIQPPGKRRMTVDAYLRGHSLKPGIRLGT